MSKLVFITRPQYYHSVFQQGSSFNVLFTFYVTVFQFISLGPEAAVLICSGKKKTHSQPPAISLPSAQRVIPSPSHNPLVIKLSPWHPVTAPTSLNMSYRCKKRGNIYHTTQLEMYVQSVGLYPGYFVCVFFACAYISVFIFSIFEYAYVCFHACYGCIYVCTPSSFCVYVCVCVGAIRVLALPQGCS